MPRLTLTKTLAHASGTPATIDVRGGTVAEAVTDALSTAPALKPHLFHENGSLKGHILVAVDGCQASLETTVHPRSDIRILLSTAGGSKE